MVVVGRGVRSAGTGIEGLHRRIEILVQKGLVYRKRGLMRLWDVDLRSSGMLYCICTCTDWTMFVV